MKIQHFNMYAIKIMCKKTLPAIFFYSPLSSGPGEAEVPSSPGMRRRRSRVPSEEDDKLINYLVSAGHTHDNRERNLSIGNVGNEA